MLKKFAIFGCALIFTAFVSAVAVSAQSKPRYSGSIRGETYSYKYTEQDFENTPAWNAENGEPPISISQALKIARENLPRFVENAEIWKTRRIFLQGTNNDKWFYNIAFSCSGAVCKDLPTRQFSIIVKMDGNILEPKKIVLVDQ